MKSSKTYICLLGYPIVRDELNLAFKLAILSVLAPEDPRLGQTERKRMNIYIFLNISFEQFFWKNFTCCKGAGRCCAVGDPFVGPWLKFFVEKVSHWQIKTKKIWSLLGQKYQRLNCAGFRNLLLIVLLSNFSKKARNFREIFF